ncbi:FG-GAP repeat protein [Synechococcus elongatus FACHB-1061]|nr:FG-GAP repeat protein [Synechococcus elongatus FACHB-242]MBD2688447.1 FG-GAP repeat protein [Synechococcus elongatus FACHB-1061]MBD2707518.1 FG-GAP repeat protein [Synechococcus elongatus PCC 7942 = FACHB-805]
MVMAKASLNLSTLNGSNGFRINGIAAYDYSGRSVSGAGDVNGDGIDDLIIGANYADPNGGYSGQSYVVFGSDQGFSADLNLADLDGSNGFRINGIAADDRSGISVSNAGDVNGDGIADLIVGANYADPNGNLSGQSYVVFGSDQGFSAALNLSTLNGSNGFRINGIAAYDQSGFSVSSAGDVNGDGIDDLIIGAYFADPNGNLSGQSYVVFGSDQGFSAALNLADLNGSNGFASNGITASDYSGRSVSGAGDVNGDGFDDFIIGASGADPNGSASGQSYVVFGSDQGFSAALNLADLNGSNGFAINGITAYDRSGFSVSGAGDVNGDGIDDLIIGAFGADPNGTNSAGQSYVVFGSDQGFSADLNLADLDGSNGFAINGIAAFDLSGFSVNGAGDVNGDGIDDLIIGARNADPNGGASGQSYVVFGKKGGFSADLNLSALNGNNGFRINGIAAGDNSGTSVSNAGDVNGDGVDDLLIGANYADPNGNTNAGQSYVVFGNAAPVLDLDGAASAELNFGAVFTGTSVSVVGSGLTITDLNSPTLSAATVTLVNRPDGIAESLSATTTGTSITATYDSNTGVLLLSGLASVEDYQQVLRSVTYTNTSNAADLDVSHRTIEFVLDDGADFANTSAVVTTSVTVLRLPLADKASVSLSSLDGGNGFRITGIAANDFSGSSVSNAGDVNGDGIDDLIIGARDADPNGTNSAGQSYVVFGSDQGFSADLNLSSLDGSNGFAINGIAAYDYSGRSVSGAGDVNGDGVDDLIIGAFGADPNGNLSGQSYVVFGSDQGFSADLNLSSLDGSNGFAINGIAADDFSGFSVSSAGDVNGDGIDDLIIGASLADPNGARSGQSYVVFGSDQGFSADLNLADLNGTNGFRINGIAVNDQSGFSVSGAGDVNGDGIDDLIIGAFLADPNGNYSGQSYVVFGKTDDFDTELNLADLDGSNGFRINGIAVNDQSGFSVSGAGDVNGDGINDLIIGALGASPHSNTNATNAGQTYVVFGSDQGFSADLNLSALNGRNGFAINGITAGDESGRSVSGAGDVNGDGIDDLIIGASNADPNGNFSGQSYVVFGKKGGFAAELNLSDLNGVNGFAINGITAGDGFGSSVSGAGDVNGDGIDDLLIGAPTADPNGSQSGQSYVVFGNAAPVLDLDGTTSPELNFGAVFTGTPVSVVGSGLTITDLNSPTLAAATVTLVNRPDGIAESLSAITDGTAIKASYDSNTGVLLLVGLATVADYEKVLRTVTYTNTSNAADLDVSRRTIEFVLDDGADFANTSAVVTTTLSFKNEVNTITGTPRLDFLRGSKGDDLITGLGGNDFLFGRAGNDTLIGGLGSDVLSGGAGKDRFVYTAVTEARDLIIDFNAKQDVLDLSGLLDSLGYQGSNPVADQVLRLNSQSFLGTTVSVNVAGLGGVPDFVSLVTLLGVSSSALVIGENIII